MAWPQYIPDYKKSRSKLVSEKISFLTGENKKLPKYKKRTHKQIVAMAINMYPKQKKAPLA